MLKFTVIIAGLHHILSCISCFFLFILRNTESVFVCLFFASEMN